MKHAILIDLVDTVVRLPFSPKNKLTELIADRTAKDIQKIAYSICNSHPGLTIPQFLSVFCDSVNATESQRAQISDVWIRSAQGAEYLPGVPEALQSLRDEGYIIVLVSNGAPPTSLTIQKLGLSSLVDAIVLSYDIGATKPDERIFRAALSRASAQPRHSWMVGDKLQSDIVGAKRVGIPGVLVNPDTGSAVLRGPAETPVAEVASLGQFVEILGQLERVMLAHRLNHDAPSD